MAPMASVIPAIRDQRGAAANEHAALAISRLSREFAGQLTVVALGPLTNLALALRLDPELPRRVARLVIMGGAVNGRGNTHLVPAEFNIGFDPEAAHVVFSNWPTFDLVDWEATMHHGLAYDDLEQWLAADDERGAILCLGFPSNAKLGQATWTPAHAFRRRIGDGRGP
jgi:inosine-uridine nucleoside N-ribohydrolase